MLYSSKPVKFFSLHDHPTNLEVTWHMTWRFKGSFHASLSWLDNISLKIIPNPFDERRNDGWQSDKQNFFIWTKDVYPATFPCGCRLLRQTDNQKKKKKKHEHEPKTAAAVGRSIHICVLILKTTGDGKRRVCMTLFEATIATWGSLQIATHKSVPFTPHIVLICALQFADFLRLCLSPRTTSRTISVSIFNSF